MVAIPPAKDSDAEDVVWGLQTAEALWKRGERIDAIVWLRRAAQAAGEATDDDRALELARAAAELSDWMATLPAGSSNAPPAPVPTRQPPPNYDPHNASTFVPYGDDELASLPPPPAPLASPATVAPQGPPTYVPDGGPTSIEVDLEVAEAARGRLPAFHAPAAPPAPRPAPPRSHPPSSPTMQTAEPHFPEAEAAAEAAAMPGEEPADSQRPSATSVPPAERVHAGMFNPWDDRPSPAPVAPPPPPEPRFDDHEEVITSVRPQQLAQQRADALATALAPKRPASDAPPVAPSAPSAPSAPAAPPAPVKPSPPRPPPLPPRARKPAPPAPPAEAAAPAAAVPPSPPVPASPATEPEPGVENPASEPPAPPEPEPAPEAALRASAAAAVEPPSKLDLDDVDAFSDLPDDARTAFAAAAKVSVLGEGEEVSSFALAYILSGTVDVAATMVDAPAARLAAGAVLRARGTTDEGVPMRLIGVSSGVVATWTDAEVDEAFRTCPWVEEDLRTAADRVQTLVGVTIGPLGERLDASIREQIIGRLTMRTLSPGEVVVTAGQPVPGLLLVGVGELELVDGDDVAGVVGSGEFLFAGEVLGAGAAPRTARAGAGGALILFGDRMIAQELLVTCPPLLEVFAGM